MSELDEQIPEDEDDDICDNCGETIEDCTCDEEDEDADDIDD